MPRSALRRETPALRSAVVTGCCAVHGGTRAHHSFAARRLRCLSWRAGDKIVCIPHAGPLACWPACLRLVFRGGRERDVGPP